MPDGEKDISVGTPLIVLVDDESAVEKFKDYKSSGASSAPKADAAPKQEDSHSAGPGTCTYPCFPCMTAACLVKTQAVQSSDSSNQALLDVCTCCIADTIVGPLQGLVQKHRLQRAASSTMRWTIASAPRQQSCFARAA